MSQERRVGGGEKICEFQRLGIWRFADSLRPDMTRMNEDPRAKQIAVGAAIILVLALTVCGCLLGWGYLPGLLGEWVGTMVGVLTTPFFMEASFICIGLTVVVALNSWRQRRDGDELVYLEQLDGPDVPSDLPEHAKWAVYREKPLPGETPTLLAQAEGALAIGDFQAAADSIGEMSEAELKRPETLVLRLELAKATGKSDLAGRLENELKDARSGNR
jgi:hypothetical protein